MWGGVGRCGEMWGDVGRYVETGRCGERWGEMDVHAGCRGGRGVGEELMLALAIRSLFSSYVVGELSSGVGEHRQRESVQIRVCNREDSGGRRNREESGGLWRTLEDSGGLWRNLEESRGRAPVWPNAVRRKDTTR